MTNEDAILFARNMATPAAKVQFVLNLLRGPRIEPLDPEDPDEEERYEPGLISKEQAIRILEAL